MGCSQEMLMVAHLNELTFYNTAVSKTFTCVYYSDDLFRKSISRLKEDIVTANSLVQEANYLAEEMGKQIKYSVTLQIPPANLSPNRKVSIISGDRILVLTLSTATCHFLSFGPL